MTLKSAQQQGYLLTEAEQRKLEKLILEEYKAADKAIQARLDKLAAQMVDVSVDDRYSWYIQYDRNLKMQKDLRKIYTNYDLSAMNLTRQSGNIGMANNYYRQYYLLNFQTPLKTAVLNPSLLNYAVTGDIKSWQALSKAVKAKYGSPAIWSPNGTLTNLFQKNRVDALRKIQLQINSGLMAGTSFRDISKNVSGIIGTVADGKASGQLAKALRITRTEGNRLMNAGSLATSAEAEAQGVKMVKVWDATLDSGTRPAHGEADGQQKKVGEPFIVDGEELMYPGDSAGSEGNIINCRCTTTDLVEGQSPQLRRARDPATGKNKVINYQTYPEWAAENDLTTNKYGQVVPK